MSTNNTISAGTFVILSGQIDTGDDVLSGGTLVVAAGGAASDTSDTGSETVLAGGTDVGAIIGPGGVQTVFGSAAM